MTNKITLSVVLGLLIFGVWVFYQSAAVSSRSGDGSPLYSTRRYDPYGTAALKDLLAERGLAVRELERPNLEPSDRGVLVQVLPFRRGWFGLNMGGIRPQQLVDWMTQGNTVIQFSRKPTELMTHFKIAATTQPSDTQTSEVQDFETQGKSPGETPAEIELAPWSMTNATSGKSLMLWSPMLFAENKDARWRVISRIKKTGDNIVAAEYRVGTGKLIVVGAPTPALNGLLGQHGNLDFVLAAVGNGPVIIDEWSHGIGHEATVIGFIRSAGLLPVLFQLVFLIALYVWSTYGIHRHDDVKGTRRRSSVEQIETLGFLYGKSLGKDITFRRVYGEVQRRLAQALRCPPAEISKHLASLKPDARQKVEQILERIQRLGPGHGPQCEKCGYDLTLNVTGRCPECGTTISPEMQHRIAEAGDTARLPARAKLRGARIDSAFADVLTLSYQFVEETKRDRRAV